MLASAPATTATSPMAPATGDGCCEDEGADGEGGPTRPPSTDKVLPTEKRYAEGWMDGWMERAESYHTRRVVARAVWFCTTSAKFTDAFPETGADAGNLSLACARADKGGSRLKSVK